MSNYPADMDYKQRLEMCERELAEQIKRVDDSHRREVEALNKLDAARNRQIPEQTPDSKRALDLLAAHVQRRYEDGVRDGKAALDVIHSIDAVVCSYSYYHDAPPAYGFRTSIGVFAVPVPSTVKIDPMRELAIIITYKEPKVYRDTTVDRDGSATSDVEIKP